MTTQRVRREAKRHRGVKVLRLKDGRHVARWIDPLGGSSQQASLDKLGLTSDKKRRRWARAKALQLTELRRAVSLGTVTASRMTPSAAVADCLDGHAHKGTKATKKVVLDAFAEWCKEIGVKTLADLSGPRLLKWRDKVLKPSSDGHMMSTRNRWLAVTRYFLRWCVKRGTVPLLTSDAIRHGCEHAPEPKREIEFLRPPQQVRQALEAALAHDAYPGVPRKVAAVALALLLSGARVSEVVGLEWNEVDLEAGEIRLRPEHTKTRTGRTITFRETPSLGVLLQRLSERRGDSLRVFPDITGPSWQSAVRRMVAKHKAPAFLTAHVLRRTCGTVLTCSPSIYGGASAFMASKRLGHSVTIAERYYLGQLRDLPATAKTLEAAAGIEDLCAKIIAAAGGKAASG